jgi:predicted NBD/HSP70 family sugar kinase
MPILALDLGGTKLASAVLDESGTIIYQDTVALEGRKHKEVGSLISNQVKKCIKSSSGALIRGIGVSVPGISYKKEGTVWAPNIEGMGKLSTT